jgi:putative mRNA 3-end processing factor
VCVVAGDWTRSRDPTAAPFEPVPCDTFVTEATFGLPIFRWPDPAVVIADIRDWWRANRARARTSVLFTHALGTAPRLLAALRDAVDEAVLVHEEIADVLRVHRAHGVALPETRVVPEKRARGQRPGALVVAPVSAHGKEWLRRFPQAETALASGWMRIRGTRRWKSVGRGFVLADHADWPDLLRTLDDVGASRVRVTHGFAPAFARYLQERGRDALAWSTPYADDADAGGGP